MICQTRPIGHVRGAVYSVVTHIYYFYTRSFSTFVFFFLWSPFFLAIRAARHKVTEAAGDDESCRFRKSTGSPSAHLYVILGALSFSAGRDAESAESGRGQIEWESRDFSRAARTRSFLSIDDERFFGSSPSCTPVRFIAWPIYPVLFKTRLLNFVFNRRNNDFEYLL